MSNLQRIKKAGAMVAVTAIAISTPTFAQDAAAGAKLYQQRCSTCHSLDVNKIGPKHRGVVGRKSASVPGYAYSKPLVASGLVWSEANIDRWLQGPQKMVKGSKMYFIVPSPAERANIIAYLKSQK